MAPKTILAAKSALRRLVGRFVHPYPRFSYLPLHMFSPMDVTAEREGITTTERLFTQAPIARIAAAFSRYLDDAEALRALKKEVHTALEPRLRAVALTIDPPEKHGFGPLPLESLGHPFDAIAAEALRPHLAPDQHLPEIPHPPLILCWGNLLATAGLLLGALVWFTLSWGRIRTPRPVSCQVSGPNFWSVRTWEALREIAREHGVWRDGGIVVVPEIAASADSFRASSLDTLDLSSLRVPIADWTRRVAAPGCRLIFTVLATTLRDPKNRSTIEVAVRTLNLGLRSLSIWRLGFTLRARWFLECADDSSLPVLRAIILRKFGTGSVRWPYSQNESPGIHLSYLGYDLFLAFGNAQEAYRQSWRPECRYLSIGQIRMDRRLTSPQTAESGLREEIERRLAAGEKMAVYFAGTLGVGFEQPIVDTARTMLETFANQPGWFVVIKPKGTDKLHDVLAADPACGALMEAPNVLAIRYPVSYQEVCPPAWLIPRMALAATLPGSVQLEGLVNGKRVFAYWPVDHPTVVRDRLRQDGFMVTSRAELADRLRSERNGTAARDVDTDWYRWAGDPFADDDALVRLVLPLFGRETPVA